MDTITTTETTTTIERPRITAEQFTQWALVQPKGERYELYDGMVVRVPNEGYLHSLTKSMIGYRLMQAIEEAGLRCDVFIDAMQVKIVDQTVFEPDVVVRCGERLSNRASLVLDPVIAVEVLSPSSISTDLNRKREGYMRVPSLRHYLVVDAEERLIIHFRRGADGNFTDTEHREGPLTLDPPGITIDRLFP
jgi:Uma2 family endonuclease